MRFSVNLKGEKTSATRRSLGGGMTAKKAKKANRFPEFLGNLAFWPFFHFFGPFWPFFHFSGYIFL